LSAADFGYALAGTLIIMDHIRDSVRLRAYGGRDPWWNIKTRAQSIRQLLATIDLNIAENILKPVCPKK